MYNLWGGAYIFQVCYILKWAFNGREKFSVDCELVCVCVCVCVHNGENQWPTRTADRMTSSGRYCVSEPSLIEQELSLGDSAVSVSFPC